MNALSELRWHGTNLHRPECVLCTSDGSLFVSDWGGGVCHIRPDGRQRRILAVDAPVPIRPNGIALMPDGSFLLANLGDDGGVWRLHQDGNLEPYLTDIDGDQLPPCNYVMLDRSGRVWITVSTTKTPRALGYRKSIADGYVIVTDSGDARIVADRIGYTNEVQVDPTGKWLYVNETFGRRLSRFPLSDDGVPGDKELVAEFGRGVFPDGLAFDEDGCAWVVSIVSNSVLRIHPSGQVEVVLQDADDDHISRVEQAYVNDEMDRPHLDQVKSAVLQNISSIAFGGPDRTIAYLGCLLGKRVASFKPPTAGVRPVHWEWNQEWPE